MRALQGTPFERFYRGFGTRGQNGGGSGQRHFYAQAQGSGFFISADGYIVTNNHVVANALKLEGVTDDGTVLDAKVVGTDPIADSLGMKEAAGALVSRARPDTPQQSGGVHRAAGVGLTGYGARGNAFFR